MKKTQDFFESFAAFGWTLDLKLLIKASQDNKIDPNRLIDWLAKKNGYRYYNSKVFIKDFELPYYMQEDLIRILIGELKIPALV